MHYGSAFLGASIFADDTLEQGSFGTWSILPSTSMADSVTGLRYAECSHAPDYINIGYLGRWGTHACPQCLPSDTVPIRSWTRTPRRPGIRHRHLPYQPIMCIMVPPFWVHLCNMVRFYALWPVPPFWGHLCIMAGSAFLGASIGSAFLGASMHYGTTFLL